MTEPKQKNILGEMTQIKKYNPDLAKQVTQQIELDEQQAEIEERKKAQIKEEAQKQKEQQITSATNQDKPIINGYIYVPSLGFYVGKAKKLARNNWYDCHRQLAKTRELMPTIPEFVEFLNYLRENPNGVKDASEKEIKLILDNILSSTTPYQGEWLDARFQTNLKEKKIYIRYNHEVSEDGIVKHSNAELLENCLIEDLNVKIDLDDWLDNPTTHGLPNINVKPGHLIYESPRLSLMTSVARICKEQDGLYLRCVTNPSQSSQEQEVRPILNINPTN